MSAAANLFFLGKGGVGKSTSAALYSLALTAKGAHVLLVSLDPAHNQSDIFETARSAKPVRILSNLEVLEIDQDQWIKQYLNGVQQQLRHTYSYLSAFNLDHHFKVLKYSPGLEEYALLLAFKKISEKYADYDYLLFDMPPTALALKFFNLPRLSLLWMEQLLALRQEIIRKREMITTVKWGSRIFEQDKVLNKITEMRQDYLTLQRVFQNRQQTQIQLVLNADRLSQAESVRIFNGLQQLGIDLYRLVNNKTRPETRGCQLNNAFKDIPAVQIPLAEEPLIGVASLQHFLQVNQFNIM